MTTTSTVTREGAPAPICYGRLPSTPGLVAWLTCARDLPLGPGEVASAPGALALLTDILGPASDDEDSFYECTQKLCAWALAAYRRYMWIPGEGASPGDEAAAIVRARRRMTDTPVITALTSITQLMRGSDEEPVITEEGRARRLCPRCFAR